MTTRNVLLYEDNDSSSSSFTSAADTRFSSRSIPSTRRVKTNKDNYYQVVIDETDDDSIHQIVDLRPPRGSLSDFFFGFMYDDDNDNDQEETAYRSSTVDPATKLWNPLNAALFLSLTLSTAATAVPVTLVSAMTPHLVDDAHNNNNNNNTSHQQENDETASSFAPTAAAVLGASLGKLIHGPVGDLCGARRTSVVYACCQAVSLVALAAARTMPAAAWACFYVEFWYAVQWPTVVIALAGHYNNNDNNNNTTAAGMYEGGILVTSLAARLGSLLSIPGCALLLAWGVPWRCVALLGAWLALLASAVTYLHVSDAPDAVNQPQNPINEQQWRKWFQMKEDEPISNATTSSTTSLLRRTGRLLGMARFVLQTNVWPSVRHVLQSGTFWIVALAHTGASVVRTSERILGAYFYETSLGTLAEGRAAGLAVSLSAGTAAGLLLAGNAFASGQERQRKWLVWRLYLLSIAACYALAFFAIPVVRHAVHAPDLILIFQVMAVCLAGFGIAVQFYHIPSLVGATFGRDKGLFAAYTDGVGYGLASMVWGVVGDSVQKRVEDDNDDGGGWAYGWAAVALLLVLSAFLMVEFMEHYFCRKSRASGGDYETIIFA